MTSSSTLSPVSRSSPPLSPLGEQVRRFDRDRFITTLMAPPARREALFALYAFNIEVARIAELVREPLLGRIRLQWWRDSLASVSAGGRPPSPIMAALADAMAACGLDLSRLDRILDTHEADFAPEPPADLRALTDYAAGTSGVLARLAFDLLGGGRAGEAAESLGTGWGLTGLLRAVPFHASLGRLYLPAGMLASAGVDAARVLAGQGDPGLAGVARRIADEARAHLAQARRHRRDIPRDALAAMLTGPLADGYLNALARQGYNLFAPGWGRLSPRPLRLLWHRFTGGY